MLDTFQKTVLGITIGATITASVVMIVSLASSGVRLSKKAQVEEIENLEFIVDELILYAETKKFNARGMFIEHCEARLDTWEKLHGIKRWSEEWIKYYNRYHELLNIKFPQE